jgi:THO complex subunit 4
MMRIILAVYSSMVTLCLESRGGRGRGGRDSRPKKKTTDELDAEMPDYFPSTEGNFDAGLQGTAGGDVVMDDQML